MTGLSIIDICKDKEHILDSKLISVKGVLTYAQIGLKDICLFSFSLSVLVLTFAQFVGIVNVVSLILRDDYLRRGMHSLGHCPNEGARMSCYMI